MKEGYRQVRTADLHVGDIVIMERRHFDYKSGRPVESEYFRAVVGEHMTVAGPALHLKADPSFEWPQIPPWQLGWIYAGNNELEQMWREERDDENKRGM